VRGGISLVNGAPGYAVGIRVLEMTGAVAGPFASRLLADLGAEVIKIERPPLGDMIRYITAQGFSAPGQYAYASAGKKSVCIDVEVPEGREIVLELARHVDVFLENFRPGAVERLGFDDDALRAVNPDIVVCSVSGYGHTGPLRDARAVDATIQSWSGMASMIGDADGIPYTYRSAPCDSATGAEAALGILASLYHRAVTGQALRIDVAMLDCAIALDCLSLPAILASDGSRRPHRAGRLHPSGVVGVGRAAGRDVVLELEDDGPDSAWARLAAAIGRPGLLDDPRFADRNARIENEQALFDVIDEWLSSFADADAALDRLRSAGIAAAPVLTPWEALTDPGTRARGMVRDVPRADGSAMPSIASPYRFSGGPAEVGSAAFVGEHNEEILEAYLGFDADRIAELTARGVLHKEEIPARADLR
jgi:CoA:oxalate CoA-transferase